MDGIDFSEYGIYKEDELRDLINDYEYDLEGLRDIVQTLGYVATDNNKHEASDFLDNVMYLLEDLIEREV